MVQRRNTKQRQLVMDVVRELDDHPTADEIYLKARETDPRISRGTVYRNLALLSDEGELLSVRIGNACHYDHNTSFHAHLVCQQCGSVIDVPVDEGRIAGVSRDVAASTGYDVEGVELTFVGTCPTCRQLRQDDDRAAGQDRERKRA